MAYGEFAKIYDELINEDINYNEMVDFILKVWSRRPAAAAERECAFRGRRKISRRTS